MTLASKTGQVKFLRKGERGMMPYPAGVYDVGKTYIATANIAPYVLNNGLYYVMNRVTSWVGQGVSANMNTPQKDYAVNGSNATWIPFEEYKAVYVELFMADFAKLASAIFSGEHMFSQQGVDAAGNVTSDYHKFGTDEFTPNILLDFLTGKSVFDQITIKGNSEFFGVLKGVSGSFKRLNCVNDKGDVVGGISLGSDGKMWFDGDMYHQGYNSDRGSGYRFYTTNLWCRGAFGARERTTMLIRGSKGYYYPNGLSKPSVMVNLEAKPAANGDIYYVIPCYGEAGDYSGMPVDIISFDAVGGYIYLLEMFDTQRVMIANVSHRSFEILSNGTKVSWAGGEIAEVVKMESLLTPSPDTNALGRGLLIGAGRVNSW